MRKRSQSFVMLRRLAVIMTAAAAICSLWATAVLADDGEPGDVTQAPEGRGAACGMIVYDWNGPVEKDDRGFPSEKPPRENFNWKKPTNYAAGELFFRAEIFRQPKPQEMRLQLCFWQPEATGGHPYRLESCGTLNAIEGKRGEVVTWSRKVEQLWKKNGVGVDWSAPRSRASVAIKNSSRQPVSNFSGWDWNGENPQEWYPLNMRFTAVVVPEGGEFCGWDYYFTPSAVEMASFTVAAPGEPQAAPALVAVVLAMLTGTALLFHSRRQ